MSSGITFTLLGASVLLALGIMVFCIAQMMRNARAGEWPRFWWLIGVLVLWLGVTGYAALVWFVMLVSHAHGPEKAANIIYLVTGGIFAAGLLLGTLINILRPSGR